MVKQAGRAVALVVVAMVVVAGTAGRALAIDAPKWVAAIFVEAQRSVGLRWTPVPGATGYKVLRSEKAGAGYAEIAAPATPQHFDQAVEPGSTYYYVLQAVAGAEASPNSVEKFVTIPGQKKVALAAPEWRMVQATSTTEFGKTTFKVGLQWIKNLNVVAYNVYRSEVAGKDHQLIGSVSEDQYVDTAVQEGKTYYYILTGLDNNFQESPFSAEKSVKLEPKKAEEKKATLANPKLVIQKTKQTFRSEGAEGWRWGVPADSAVDSEGNIYTIDVLESKVRIHSHRGEYLKSFGERGGEPGQMVFPTGIGIDSDDNVWVTDRSTPPRVLAFTSDGRFLRQIEIPPPDAEFLKQFTLVAAPLARDVAVGKDGRIYVVDNQLSRVVIVSEDGKEFKTVGAPGGAPGQFNSPGWIAISPKGEVHVTDGINRRISVFDPDGNFLRVYGISKSFIGSFVGATGITFDKEGNSVVVDNAAGTVQFFNPEGVYLFTLGDEEGGIDKESRQRSNWKVGKPTGIVYNPVSGDFVFALNTERALVARRLIE